MYWVRDTPMLKGNQMPGTPSGSSNSPPNSPTVIEANVTGARIRIGPPRAMRAPSTTNNAIEANLHALVRLAAPLAAPAVDTIASATAATSTLRHGRSHQRFQARAQAATVGIHMTLASQA